MTPSMWSSVAAASSCTWASRSRVSASERSDKSWAKALGCRPRRHEYQAARSAFHKISHCVGDPERIVSGRRKGLVGRGHRDIEMVRLANIHARDLTFSGTTK